MIKYCLHTIKRKGKAPTIMENPEHKKNLRTKSRYCEHYKDCDRPENCFKGEFCPFFKYNSDIIFTLASKDISGENGFKIIMDKIWDGDKKITERKI